MKLVLLFLVLSAVFVKADLDEAIRWTPNHKGIAQNLFAEDFSYDRLNTRGPEGWTAIDAACAGLSQSPIDINTATAVFDAKLLPLSPVYRDVAAGTVSVFNTGVAIRVDLDAGTGTFTGGALPAGSSYNALQFHIHTPSDHTVNGASNLLELHIVHINADPLHAGDADPTQLTVISVLFREGASSPFLKPIADAVKNILAVDARVRINQTLPLATLVPAGSRYFTYPGSLTTPNCRQTVTWHILRDVQTASGLELQQFRAPFGAIFSNRPVQPLNARTVRSNAIVGNSGSKSSTPLAFASIVAISLALVSATKYL